MKAVISFQAGVALLEDSQGVQVLSVDGAPLAPTVRAAQHLLMSATDVIEQDVESTASLQERLEIAFACDRGLQMLLILLDAEEHFETRVLAGECCEERLQSEHVQDYVANRLHQQPLPADTDLKGSLELAGTRGWQRTLALLNEIDTSQPVLRGLLEAFEKIPNQMLEEANWPTREYAQRQLADTGMLREFCRSGRTAGGVTARMFREASREHSAGFQTFLTAWVGQLYPLAAASLPGPVAVARSTATALSDAADAPNTTTLSSPVNVSSLQFTSAPQTHDLMLEFQQSLSSTCGAHSFPDTIQNVFQFMELSTTLQSFYLSQLPPQTHASFAEAMDFLERHTTTPLTDTDTEKLGALLAPFSDFMSARQPMGVLDGRSLNHDNFCGKTWLELAGGSRDYLASLRGILNIIKARCSHSSTPPQGQ